MSDAGEEVTNVKSTQGQQMQLPVTTFKLNFQRAIVCMLYNQTRFSKYCGFDKETSYVNKLILEQTFEKTETQLSRLQAPARGLPCNTCKLAA